jgi:plastocyanin
MMGGYGSGGMMGSAWVTPPPSGPPTTGETQITIAHFAYQPANLQVHVGTMVTWSNQDTVVHTVTFRAALMQSSGLLQQGQSYRATFNAPVTFAYYCAVHPAMVGSVTVTS